MYIFFSRHPSQPFEALEPWTQEQKLLSQPLPPPAPDSDSALRSMPRPCSRDTRHLFWDCSSPSPAAPYQKWMWPWTSFSPLPPKVQSSFCCRTTCPGVPNVTPLRQQRRAQCKRERQDLSFKKQEKVFSLCWSVSLSAPDLVVFLCYWMLHPLSRPRDLPGWVQTCIVVRPHLEPHPQLSHRAPDREVPMFMPQAWGRDSRWTAEKPCGVGREVERGGTECPRSGPLPICQQGPLKTNSQKKLTSIPKGKPQSINPKGKKTDHLIMK